MKGKTLRKHSLHEKTAASALLKLFNTTVTVIKSLTTDAPTGQGLEPYQER